MSGSLDRRYDHNAADGKTWRGAAKKVTVSYGVCGTWRWFDATLPLRLDARLIYFRRAACTL